MTRTAFRDSDGIPWLGRHPVTRTAFRDSDGMILVSIHGRALSIGIIAGAHRNAVRNTECRPSHGMRYPSLSQRVRTGMPSESRHAVRVTECRNALSISLPAGAHRKRSPQWQKSDEMTKRLAGSARYLP